MLRSIARVSGLVALTLALAQGALAQGVQTGTLSGRLTTPDGQALPGASITVQSPALQGQRSAVSDGNGGYIFKGLPPGTYAVKFELTGMTTVERKIEVALARSVSLDASLSVTPLTENVTVVAEQPTVVGQSAVGANFKGAEIDRLATARTLQGIAELAPGLTDNTPNGGQVTISGAFAFDNAFLVNGVDVNDNLFGTPNNLFIEDAIDEVQVLTSGISAEYGRFQGGVVNAVTKRGGNNFSGSLRADFTNPAWRDETPLEERQGVKRQDKTAHFLQATLGGPLVKDKLWFFLAGRTEEQSTDNTFNVTGLPFTNTQSNDRIQGQLTATLSPNHTIQGSYLRNSTEQTGPSLASLAAEPATFYQPSRTLPNNLLAASYNGVLSPRLFVDIQFSQKKFEFENSGGRDTNIATGSPIFSNTFGVYYNAPFFDSTDPESRDNRQIAGSLSYFLSSSRLGRHDIKAGYENFRTTHTGGNSQSPTNYVFYSDWVSDARGNPVYDAQGRLQPAFGPGSGATLYLATRNARQDITTNSFYLNDKWTIDEHWSANLGARYERVRGVSTGEIISADTDTFVPRVALSFDVKGDGRFRLDATYAHYAGKYNEAQFGANTPVGSPNAIYLGYTGPTGSGRNFAPGFDPANYGVVTGGFFPTIAVRFDPNLSSPVTKEFTLAAGTQFARGYLKGIYTQRKVTGVFEDFIDRSNGTTDVTVQGVSFGLVDNVVFRNTDEPKREYRALQFQSAYRFSDRLNVQGHWTVQLRNNGDYEGEGANTPGATTRFGDYSELYSAARHFPDGRLNDFQRHKARVWATYDVSLGRAGRADMSLMWRYNSGLTASLVANNQAFTATQLARWAAAGYASLPSFQLNDVFYGERGSVQFAGAHLFDVALNYELPLFRSLRPWFKADVRNVMNKQALIGYNTNVRQDPNTPVDALGLRTGYQPTSAFGQARNNADYTIPREFRFSVGLRF